MTAAIATVLCGAFLAGSAVTFTAAWAVYQRARRVATRAAKSAALAEEKLAAANRARSEAAAIHKNCGAQGIPFVRGPLGVVPRGVA